MQTKRFAMAWKSFAQDEFLNSSPIMAASNLKVSAVGREKLCVLAIVAAAAGMTSMGIQLYLASVPYMVELPVIIKYINTAGLFYM